MSGSPTWSCGSRKTNSTSRPGRGLEASPRPNTSRSMKRSSRHKSGMQVRGLCMSDAATQRRRRSFDASYDSLWRVVSYFAVYNFLSFTTIQLEKIMIMRVSQHIIQARLALCWSMISPGVLRLRAWVAGSRRPVNLPIRTR